MAVEPVGRQTALLTPEHRPRRLSGVLNFARRADVLLPLVALVAFLGLWEIGGRLLDPLLFAPPSRVVMAYRDLLESGLLLQSLVTTLQTLLTGYVLAMVVGLVIGVVLGRVRSLGQVLEPYIDALFATPNVVLVPLVILWFGVGPRGRLFIVFLSALLPIIINTTVGVRNTRRDLLEMGYSFGANETQLVRHIILPGAVPYVVAGLRIAAGRALIGVIVAEMFLDLTGLGGLIQTNAAFFRTDRMLASIVVIAVVGILFSSLLGTLERRVQAWRA